MLETQRRYQDLLEAAPDGIIEVDSDGCVTLLNTAAERLSGYRREELLGQPLEVLIPVELRERHRTLRANYMELPVTRPMGTGLDLMLLRKNGAHLPVEISLSPLRYGEDIRVTAIIRDASERREAERKLHDMQTQFMTELTAKNEQLLVRNAEVERAARLKTEFVASISHELRTPLHTIIGFAELLDEEKVGQLNEKQKRFVNHIHKDSLHLLELINDILDLSKIESGRLELRPTTFEAMAAVDEAAATIRPQAAGKNLTLVIAIAPNLILFGDRVRFKQVLFNLLSNAVKFTPAYGKICVQGAATEGMAEIAVTDTGVGIPLSEQAVIFDKFYQSGTTTRGVKEGTGLGLAITKELVEMHGGSITVQSAPQRGSAFRFTIPVAPQGRP